MKPAYIDELAANEWRGGAWWQREAALAWKRRDAWIIPGRNDDDVYLVRFWLSQPVRRERSDGACEVIESGDSLLLHFFARGDDDQSLHDHPWDFRTTILNGGYWEHLPPLNWQKTTIDDGFGPDWNMRRERRNAGDTVGHLATDLHCVGEVDVNTWTLVRTGPRVREWGFHPEGRRWVDYKTFLKAKKEAAA